VHFKLKYSQGKQQTYMKLKFS